ncbi:MAG: hypothetical protein IIB37_11925 [Gemmatimonadetes bacterium]|nr:hypothetical protein [Gemmatimonadota bacterium]MCH7935206.1 hypothetical protein [Gemmatimonadota bacterium]
MSDPITRLNTALDDRYRIGSELGEGGMATVYLADDIKHERKVALKVLKPELAAVVGAERFLAEIKTTANLTHPHCRSPVALRPLDARNRFVWPATTRTGPPVADPNVGPRRADDPTGTSRSRRS